MVEKPSNLSPQRERSFGLPVLDEDNAVEGQEQQDLLPNGATHLDTSAHSSPPISKENWHSRKISWGKDMIMGQEAGGGTGATAADHTNNASTDYAATATPTSEAAVAATAAAARSQKFDAPASPEEQDPDVLKAEHIQSLFAGQGGGAGGGIYNSHTNRRNISSLGNIDLDDVLKESPYESEAEAYILRAIEDRDKTSDGKHESSYNVLPDIPDDAMSALSNRTSSDDGGDDDSHGGGVQNSDSHFTTHNSEGGGNSSSNNPRSRRTSYSLPLNSGAGGGGGSAGGGWGRIKNMVKDHRRNQTMESQLYGLADAINAMHGQHWDSSEQHWMGGGRSSSPTGIPNDQGHSSSAEALQQNASLLYNRGNKNANKNRARPGLDRGFSYRHIRGVSELSAGSAGRNSDAGAAGLDPSQLKSLHLSDIEEGGDGSDDGLKDNLLDDPEHPIEHEDEDDPAVPEHKRKHDRTKNVERQLVRELHDFFAPQKTTIVLYFRVMFLYIALPLLGISAVLFYWGGNGPTGRLAYGGHPVNGTLWNTDGERVGSDETSISWWLIFIVRLIVTFTLAKVAEKFFIDYLTIRTRGTITLCGPMVTLLLLQSKGWPSTFFLWGIFNFILLSGPTTFSEHWAYWQESIGLFNDENPGGDVVDSEWLHKLLAIFVAVGVVVAFKRLLLGLYLGKRTFNAYADQLATVMKNILMISEVAALAKDFEREMRVRAHRTGISGNQYVARLRAERDKLFGIFDDINAEEGSKSGGLSNASKSGGLSTAEKTSNPGDVDYIVDSEDRNPWSGSLTNAQQMRIVQLLGAWEEPVIAERKVEYISVSALLQFRRSMACLHTPFPFSGSFGLADTRENCIQSAQEVYRRLLLNDPDSTVLNFETLALLGLQNDGSLNQAKLKEMIRLFRPNRDGTLSILEFVKSIDTVYKEIRMLRASVTNASKIDKSFETIFNLIFYAVVIVIILSQLGYSPMAMFLSISGVILAFAFMIGSASSKAFEGILFILVRRPYAIGDGIAVGNVESVGTYTGHPFWLVEDVTLFTTSVMYFYTGERATLSNGSLANSRIINVSRSPHAFMYILLKFPIDVPHEKLQIFHTAVEQFCRNRPREWRSFDSFRATQVDAENGYLEMMVVATHRLSWIEWTTIHTSKADLINFCTELSKKLGIWYKAPPVPVDLTFKNNTDFASMLPQASGLQGANMPSTPMASSSQLQEADLSGLQAMFPPRS